MGVTTTQSALVHFVSNTDHYYYLRTKNGKQSFMQFWWFRFVQQLIGKAMNAKNYRKRSVLLLFKLNTKRNK